MWLDDLIQDARFGLRMLARRPAFAAAAVLTLAFGIGLSVAMFTVFDAVLRRPLPVEGQDRVVVLWAEAEDSIRRLPLTYAHFERFREAAQTLQEVGGVLAPRGWPHAIRDGERGLSLNLAAVTGNFFTLLGVRPVIGRLLADDDDVEGAPRVLVISHGLWHRHFGGDPGVLGRTLTLHERQLTYTVVGVAPPGLEYPAGAELWVPLRPFAELEAVPIARLAHGASPADAAAELRASFWRDGPAAWRDVRGVARPFAEVVSGDVAPALRLLTAAAALLFLIACFNVANLLLARASARTHEMAIRRALGAGRARVARQLLTESLLIALAAGSLGALLAGILIDALLALAPPELPRVDELRASAVPLWSALFLSAAAALTFGVVPALLASGPRTVPAGGGDRSATASTPRRRLQDALVVLQIALTVFVLSAAGLLGRSLLRLQQLDMGFAADRLAIVELAWPHTKFDSADAVRAFHARLLPELEALPGVVSVAPTHLLPFEGATGGIDGRFVADGTETMDAAVAPTFSMEVVGPGYFGTLGIPMLRGRAIAETDREDSPRVMVVTESVARTLWPGGEALGRRLGMGRPKTPDEWWTVIGMVPDIRYREMRQRTPTVYVPARQFMSVNRIAIRTAGEPAEVLPAVRRVVQDTDADTIVATAHTMPGLLARELAQPRLSTMLVSVFGAGALVLSGVGLYAMLAYLVRRRTRELAIRHALGASPSRLRALVMRHALMLAGIGAVAGLASSLAGGRLIESLLFGTSPADPQTLTAVAALVVIVALASSYIPARRAMQADPAAVLRQE
jgi:putative ABC transport system permease protein